MAEAELYKIIISVPARDRYQENILPYLQQYFSLERAIEIDENILNTTETLGQNPYRGSKERYLEEAREAFRFILHKETRQFEIKIIYYISEAEKTVYVTDFFPTKMDPHKITRNK